VPAAIDEGFLLLFSKKEALSLPFFLFAYLGSYEKRSKNFSDYA
jgi:hypothetical protein